MEPLVDSLNHFVLSWERYVFSATWQSILIGGFLLIVVWMCRKLPDRVRYSILLSGSGEICYTPNGFYTHGGISLDCACL